MIACERRLQRGDAAVGAHAEPGKVALVAIGRGGEEMLGARLHPLDRPADAAGHGGDQHFFGIGVPLAAEAAADVGGEDSHVLLGETEGARDRGAHGVGHLGRAPHREASIVSRWPGQDAARLQRHRSDPRERQLGGDDKLRLGESRLDGAHSALRGPRDVVGPFREHARRAGSQGRVDVGGGGQDFVVDAHRERGVGGAIAIVREYDGHRFARVAHHRARDGGMGIWPEIRGGDEGRNGRLALRQVGAAEHRDHARHGERGFRVDAHDARVGVRAPHDDGVEHVGQAQVVEIAPATGDEAAIFLATDGTAQRAGHGRPAVYRHVAPRVVDMASVWDQAGRVATINQSDTMR